jgi:hypothetical protein
MDVLYPVTLQIDPNCLSFLEAYKQKSLSDRQEAFMGIVKETYNTLTPLKDQSPFEFSEENEAEIARGAFFALTGSLEEKFSRQRKINLIDLQSCLKEEFNISDEHANFIIRCLVKPIWLPFSLPTLANFMLTNNYYCSNESTYLDPTFQYALKAEPGTNDGTIIFKLTLSIKKVSIPQAFPIGTTNIRFSINNEKQIEFIPIEMRFDFPDKEESERFQAELVKDFRTWLLAQDELDKMTASLASWPSYDIWLIPILIGLLVGLIATIALIALNLLTPIMPLFLPPSGLMLGLLLATAINIGCYISIKNDREKIKRPIRLLNQKKPSPQAKLDEGCATTSFFENRNKLDSAPPSLTKEGLALKPSP